LLNLRLPAKISGSKSTVRISVGIEDVDDTMDGLDQALAAI
jgi:cystathionine beta-lyase/cystathionine gamma-synthase